MSGWFGTAVGILVYDLWRYKNGKLTMSAAWGKWLDHRIGRPACIIGWGVLTGHLFAPLLPKPGRRIASWTHKSEAKPETFSPRSSRA